MRIAPIRRNAVLAAAVLVAASAVAVQVGEPAAGPAVSASAKQPPRPSIGFPRPGAIVNVGTLVTARPPKGVHRSSIRRYVFQYARRGGSFHTILGPAPAGLAEPAMLWDAGSLKSGRYRLRVRALRKGGGAIVSRSVRVRVNDQPFAAARYKALPRRNRSSLRRSSQALKVRFDASKSFDADGSVKAYRWSWDAGGNAHGRAVEHTFAKPGDYPMSIQVTDDRGGTSTGHYVFSYRYDSEYYGLLTSFTVKTSCGCKKMSIKSMGDVEGPKGFDFSPESTSGIPAGEQRRLGAYNDGEAGDQLDRKKKGEYTVKCRLQVIAELHDESKPQLCAEGQRAQGTVKVGGTTTKLNGLTKRSNSSDPRYDSSKSADDPYDPNDKPNKREKKDCGFGDDGWCDDDYHGGGGSGGKGKGNSEPPNKFKTYVKQERITWLDAPGLKFKTSALKPDGASFQAHFEAKVTGDLGDCKCSWDVRIEIDKDGKVTSNKVENVVCTP
jgi:PKD domain-containing protein